MRNIRWNFLILLLLFIDFTCVFSQEVNLTIKQDAKIDSLMQEKIKFDRERYKKTYYTLQLYYGNLTLAKEVLEKSKKKFPHIQVELSFETPNYKVQAGRFKEKLRGLKTLDTLKKTFPSAFLLTRKY